MVIDNRYFRPLDKNTVIVLTVMHAIYLLKQKHAKENTPILKTKCIESVMC